MVGTSARSLGLGSALLLVAGCATGVGGNEARVESQAAPVAAGASCAAPRTVAATPSALDAALLIWSADGPTEKALEALDAACTSEQGACTILALIHQGGEGVPRDLSKAADYRERASRHSRVQSVDFGSDELVEIHRDQGLHIRVESSHCYFGNVACEHGCEATCSAAAATAKTRLLVPLGRACDNGRGSACHVLASLVENGTALPNVGRVVEGGELDRAKALRLKACTLGVAASCVHVNAAKACELGLPSACLTHGDEVLRKGDQKLAATVYERSCELGMKGVCRDLAAIFGTGSSRAKDAYLKVFGGEDDVKAAHFRALGGSDLPVTPDEL